MTFEFAAFALLLGVPLLTGLLVFGIPAILKEMKQSGGNRSASYPQYRY